MARALLSNNKRNSKKLYYWILFTGHLRWERCKLAFAAKSETPNRWFLCKNCLNNSSKLKIIVSTKTAWRDTCENVSGPPEKDDYWRIPTPKGCLTELKKLRRLIKVCSQENPSMHQKSSKFLCFTRFVWNFSSFINFPYSFDPHQSILMTYS